MVSKAASEAPAEAGPPAGAADGKYLDSNVSGAAKILVVGPLGVGKTTLIGTVSEIEPLSTEASMTRAGVRVDPAVDSGKKTTTVALDFGRLTIDGDLVLYLFGTPGQQRFLPAWRDLAKGRSARSHWWTAGTWRLLSTRWTTWRIWTCPSQSPSTSSRPAPDTKPTTSARPSTCCPAPRW